MPRITAGSIPEHVARQEAAVLDAAIRLFDERGFGSVTLGDIAKEVGLARNSLYRYFPDKAHIFAAWFRRVIGPLVEECTAIAADDAPAEERLVRWADAQFGYLTDPAHAAMLVVASEIATMPEGVRAEIGAGHRELYGSLNTILRDVLAGRPERDLGVVTTFVGSLVQSAAEQVRAGADPAPVRSELERSVRSLAGA